MTMRNPAAGSFIFYNKTKTMFMKKTITVLSVLITLGACAQEEKNGGFKKGDNLLNIGIGVNSYYSGGIPFGASYEKAVSDLISVGANFDYLGSKYDYGSGAYRFRALYLGARISYHFNSMLDISDEKVDLYGGGTLGYRNFSWSDTYSGGTLSGSYGSGIYLGAFIGGKYYFGNSVGAFAELGAIGSTNARIGLAFRF